MNEFPRIGAFLTHGAADGAVLKFTGCLARLGGNERTFIMAMPEDAPLPAEWSTLEDSVRLRLREWGSDEVATAAEVDVREEPSLDEILRATRDHDLDLLVLGRRLPTNQFSRGSLYPRLVRKAPCSVLLVTQYAEPCFDRVLVPVDFSRHAAGALRLARRLSELKGDGPARIICQHISSVPYGYGYTGLSREEFAQEQHQHADQEFHRFLAAHELEAEGLRFRHTPSESEAEAVAQMAMAERVDMVILGSRGRSEGLAILMGRTAEKVVEACSAPVLVVKRKGETLKLIDALLGA